MIEHHIQREIVRRLTFAIGLRFSELKPDGMESNIFMYHIKQLAQAGYIEKQGNIYRLASKGLTYVDGLSTQNYRPRQQPKLIAVIALRNDNGAWLLAKRKSQPYIGKLMFPSGKQHKGETSVEHAKREMLEKTDATNIVLKRRGMADIQIYDQTDVLLTHVVAQIYEGKLVHNMLPRDTDKFSYVWHEFSSGDTSLMAGTAELYDLLQEKGEIHSSLRLVNN